MGPVWNLGQGKAMKALVVALLTAFLFAGACSGDDSGERSGSTGRTTGPEEGTLASSTTGQEKTEPPPPEATLGTELDSPGVVLRIEGDPKTTFAGVCTVGGKGSGLIGRVPKRYTFTPEGQGLSCRIQKRDRGGGSLKVILIADNTTRSVQQTSIRGGVITLSYKGE
jgi:hypothetical protein